MRGQMSFTIMVSGSRDWSDEKKIYQVLADLDVPNGKRVRLIHGDCRGADQIAARIAKSFNWDVKSFPAEWNKYGKKAGPMRNIQMLDQKPDLVLCFPLPSSIGTKQVERLAKERGLKTIVTSSK